MNARDNAVRTRVFKEDRSRQPQVETLDTNKVVEEARKIHEQKKAKRQQMVSRGIDDLKSAEREGKMEQFNQARRRAERQENPQLEPTGRQQNTGGAENQVQKRTAENPQSFAKWEERETAKFNAWKQRQQEKLDTWLKLNDDKPDQVKQRARKEFDQRIAKAQQEFDQRKREAEQRFKQS
jgi:hypothetical protein